MLLPSVACEELRSIVKAQTEYRLAHGKDWNAVGLVLPKRDDAPMSPSTLKSMWWTWAARQNQEWLGHGDPATTLRRCVRLTTAVRAKAVARLDEATRAALEQAEAKAAQEALPASTTSSRRQAANSRCVWGFRSRVSAGRHVGTALQASLA